jgi:opacity protein-like surface antigen
MLHRALLAVGIVVCATTPASSQVLGLPVVNNGAATGINVGADIGFANSEYYGGGTAIGARASVGIGFIGVSAMISRFAPKSGDAIVAPGAAVTMRLLGGPLVPFRITMQAGASKWDDGTASITHVPISIGLSATIPNPAFAIKPWIAPRVDYTHNSNGSIISGSDVRFGISGGVDLALLSGITIRAAYDRVNVDALHPSIFSLGLGFAP